MNRPRSGFLDFGLAALGAFCFGCTILYSKDAIEQNIAKHGGQFVTLSWRETK